jgi:DinB family protein
MLSPETKLPESWLRGTSTEISVAERAVMHALVLAQEDLEVWCGGFTDAELNARPSGLLPIAFHLRHIARSLDRPLTYPEGGQLDSEQIAAMKTEVDSDAVHKELFMELTSALASGAQRILAIDPATFEEPRTVGRKQLPTTVGGLLVPVADHTQRHGGQAITTAKIVAAHVK